MTVGDVVRVVLLFYLMPVWSVGLAWWLLGERPSAAALARVALALAGVGLVLQPAGGGWPVPHTAADFMALGGGAFFALTSVLARRLRQHSDEARGLAMALGCVLLATPLATFGLGAAAWAAWASAPLSSWLPLLLGLAALVWAANQGLQYGAARLPARVTALIMLSEIVFASLSATALGASSPNGRTALGAALTIAAAAWAAWPRPARAG